MVQPKNRRIATEAYADAAVEADRRMPQPLDDETVVYSVTDESGRRSWLEVARDARPTTHAVKLLKEKLDYPQTDPLLESTESAYVVVDEAGRKSEIDIGLDGRVKDWVIDAWKARMAGESTGHVGLQTITVKQDGTGDFTSIVAACSSITDSSESKPYEVVVHPGLYLEHSIDVRNHVTLRGTNRELCRIHGELPYGTPTETVQWISPIDLDYNGKLENLTVTARNTQYVVHTESNGVRPDQTQLTKNCHFEHLGGREDGVASTAWGYGASSGGYQRHENSTFIGESKGWIVHNNKDHDRGVNHDLVNCRIVSMGAGRQDWSLDLQSLGSGHSSLVSLINTELSAPFVRYIDPPWATVDPAKQVADHAEIELWASGTDPVGYWPACRGRALRFDSGTTTGEKIEVTGSAASLVVGVPVLRAGGGGLPSYLYGHWDISGILVGSGGATTVDNTLGRRLGNCATTPKALTVTVGAATATVTFNTDLTSASNATILAQINTALGSVATASAYDVVAGEKYPQFADRIRSMQNRTAVGIPQWSALAYGADGYSVRLLDPADPVSAFVGVALQQIPPLGYGKVLTSGLLSHDPFFGPSQFRGLAAGNISMGTTIYFSDTTPGAFSLTGTRQAAKGFLSGWARFEGAK